MNCLSGQSLKLLILRDGSMLFFNNQTWPTDRYRTKDIGRHVEICAEIHVFNNKFSVANFALRYNLTDKRLHSQTRFVEHSACLCMRPNTLNLIRQCSKFYGCKKTSSLSCLVQLLSRHWFTNSSEMCIFNFVAKLI